MAKLILVAPLALGLLVGCGPKTEPAPAAGAEPATTEEGSAPVEPAEAEEPAAATCPAEPGLCFAVDPPAAELNVDGRDIGAVSSLGEPGAAFLKVDAGIHEITLKLEGYDTWRAEVSVGESLERIEVKLNPKD